MINWMKRVNNFQIAKVQLQGVVWHLLIFFSNFSMLLAKVLLIEKKRVLYSSFVFLSVGTIVVTFISQDI